jgi:hypothetical protein
MKRIYSSLMAMVAVVVFASVGAAKPPSWDTIKSGKSRFKVIFNGEAVWDKETGLVWEQSPDGTERTWNDAHNHCINRILSGRLGQRLPTVQELASLVDLNNPDGNPDLPPGHPFDNVQSSIYSSATTDASDASEAWLVHFGLALVATDDKAFKFLVWCVRAGQAVDPQ